MVRKLTAVFFISLLPLLALAQSESISAGGKRLTEMLDNMHVEKLWLPGQRVAWESGKPLEKQPKDDKSHTHCSAFVAAACKKQDVYILRPPEHSSTMLANAQFDWLPDQGKEKGWQLVKSGIEAQHLANDGQLVVAVYKEADPKKHGHIALIRPSAKSDAKIREEGPQIIQAGMDNLVSAPLRDGFKHHKGAFQNGGIKFYSHEVTWK